MSFRGEDKTLVVMISSTALDLPEHRGGVMDACLRQSMLPSMMEHLPADHAQILEKSLTLVRQADIYVGILGYRYGTVIPSQGKSITELEYECAVSRGIPRLIFVMSEDHDVKPGHVETGAGAEQLQRFKQRLAAERIVAKFRSAEDLRALAIDALAKAKLEVLGAPPPGREDRVPLDTPLPTPPQPYIAHPYSLLKTSTGLIGRQQELAQLDAWAALPASSRSASVLSVVAIGGAGKSALTWHWLQRLAANAAASSFDGFLWWSFYESEASFENFVKTALAYVSGRSRRSLNESPALHCEQQLLEILAQRRFVVVLDGFERILKAYAGAHPAYVHDEDVAYAETVRAPRQAVDERITRFLWKAAAGMNSYLVLSTRLFPAALEGPTGLPVHGVHRFDLAGLNDDDALQLWRALGVDGVSERLLPLFRTFQNHPLLIQALACRIAYDRRTPGDFDAWRANHPHFDPFSLPMIQVKSHVMDIALEGLSEQTCYALQVVAAFGGAARYGWLTSLLIGGGQLQCAEETELISVLATLENRGLIGWDHRPHVNSYDMHAVVRGVTLSRMDEKRRSLIYRALRLHFAHAPKATSYQRVGSLEELEPTVELFNSYVMLGELDRAYDLYFTHLHAPLYKLGAVPQALKLLKQMAPSGIDELPRLSTWPAKFQTLRAYAEALLLHGRPHEAARFYRGLFEPAFYNANGEQMTTALYGVCDAMKLCGGLQTAHQCAQAAIRANESDRTEARRAAGLLRLGQILALQGEPQSARETLLHALGIAIEKQASELQFDIYQALGELAIHVGDLAAARALAERCRRLAIELEDDAVVIRTARLIGETQQMDGSQLQAAENHLYRAINQARMCGLVGEELAAGLGAARLSLQQNDLSHAAELLDDLEAPINEGGYRLLAADAQNLLAHLRHVLHDDHASLRAAEKAYQLSWCDGPPHVYAWGLRRAHTQFTVLGVREMNTLECDSAPSSYQDWSPPLS